MMKATTPFNANQGWFTQLIIQSDYLLPHSRPSDTNGGGTDNETIVTLNADTQTWPEKIFNQGASLGGIISVRDLEERLIPDIDGALLMCGAVAGSENWIEAFDLRMLYEAVCSEASNAAEDAD